MEVIKEWIEAKILLSYYLLQIKSEGKMNEMQKKVQIRTSRNIFVLLKHNIWGCAASTASLRVTFQFLSHRWEPLKCSFSGSGYSFALLCSRDPLLKNQNEKKNRIQRNY